MYNVRYICLNYYEYKPFLYILQTYVHIYLSVSKNQEIINYFIIINYFFNK